MMNILSRCLGRGHQVDVFSSLWQGHMPKDSKVILTNPEGISNHRRMVSFANKLNNQKKESNYNAVVGFNKIPDLDVYYAADTCFAKKVEDSPFWYRLTPRCRGFLQLEKAVFNNDSDAEILLLSQKEKENFIRFYHTPERRFHLMPPGISKDRVPPPDVADIRAKFRKELAIHPDQHIVLMIGSGFKTKGVDRSIRAIAALPEVIRNKTVLLIVGQDHQGPFIRLSKRLGVSAHVRFMGGRNDVPHFLFGSDVLVHPAYRENTGTAIVEAIAAQLPVIATDVCGYSYHIKSAGAGEVLPSPFDQEVFNRLLMKTLTSSQIIDLKSNARKYITKNDLFSRAEKAAEVIEAVGAKNQDVP